MRQSMMHSSIKILNYRDHLEHAEIIMLFKAGNFADYDHGEKCVHATTDGRWLVKEKDGYYAFDPPTQMQKDIWLGEARNAKEKEKRIKKLRWLCFSCNNIQEP